LRQGLGASPRPLPFSACLFLLAAFIVCLASPALDSAPASKRITWADVVPLQSGLMAKGMTASGFSAYVQRTHDENLRRVHEGDLDHLVFYALQSTRFTSLPPIEPAMSAKAFADSGQIPDAARARIAAFATALASKSDDPRVSYFRGLMKTAAPDPRQRDEILSREYSRVMRFVYEKEFVARRSTNAADAVIELYRTRGLSTDTAVEAGYVVYLGLGVMKAIAPERRVRHVLIVGPGLDLAPRTGLVEAGPPESYQPWAIVDALLALGLARVDDLEVVAADINPRVIDHLQRRRADRPMLQLVSGIEEAGAVTFSRDYRDYFASLGRAIGNVSGEQLKGRLKKTLRVRDEAVRIVRAERLDVVTERLDGPLFDLVVATNILPYFDDVQVMLAMSNVAGMIAPGGTFLHNEPRPILGEIATRVGLPLEQSRHVTVADVRAAPPLGDSVFLHRRH
jgi:hypothetical protein